jgi:hypothetical protein
VAEQAADDWAPVEVIELPDVMCGLQLIASVAISFQWLVPLLEQRL